MKFFEDKDEYSPILNPGDKECPQNASRTRFKARTEVLRMFKLPYYLKTK